MAVADATDRLRPAVATEVVHGARRIRVVDREPRDRLGDTASMRGVQTQTAEMSFLRHRKKCSFVAAI